MAIAQKKGAGLFLSIHADYFPTQIDDARGATIYTLSERASDEEARALAAKENFSDAIAGVELPSDSDELVANILIDLAQRETQNRSVVFARSIVGELAAKNKSALHTKRLRSAGFRVLKAPDVPSVLLGAGLPEQPRRREAAHLGRLARPHGRFRHGCRRRLFRQAYCPQPLLILTITPEGR